MSAWWRGRRVAVTGGRGFLGRRVVDLLAQRAPAAIATFSSAEHDLTKQSEVRRLYEEQRPDVVVHLAARVGGIGANQANPGRFFYDNAVMGVELMEQARLAGVTKYLQVGTVCAYPALTPVPFREDALWDGYPEETNAPYGLAKRMLVVQAAAYRAQYGFPAVTVLPANLYGPGDNFDPDTSHVIPALIRRCVEARLRGDPSITVWGTGSPTREFLYVDDAARGILDAVERYDDPRPLNLGTGKEVSIAELVRAIAELTGYEGEVRWDPDRPDGQRRRALSVDRARREIGFEAAVGLEDGLRRTVDWYLSAVGAGAAR